MKFLVAVLIFCAIIIIHEFGHFLFAKLSNVKVNEFSIGMGPKLFEWGKGETKYRIRLLPIGGACMMEGEDEESTHERSFNSASVWARILIVFGGPLFNFILAFLLALIVTAVAGTDLPYITSVYDNSPAAKAGLKDGVTVTEYDGYKVSLSDDVYNAALFKPLTKDGVDIKVKDADGKEQVITMYPQYYFMDVIGITISYDEKTSEAKVDSVTKDSPAYKAGIEEGDVITKVKDSVLDKDNDIFANLFCDGEEDVVISVSRDDKELEFTMEPDTDGATLRCGFATNLNYEKLDNPLQVVKYSVINVKYWIVTTIRSIGMIVKGRVSLNDLSGPVGIVKMISDDYTASVENGRSVKEKIYNVAMTMCMMTILLSANIGVMNLIPLPALDGGRLFFLIIEVIRRKKINQNVEGTIHFVGLMLLFVLMFVIMGNDILKLVR